jgi:pectate lyase
MYYVEVARGPLANRTVIFLALLATSCSGNLNPIRLRPVGQDAALTPDGALPQDSSIVQDSSVPSVCPDELVGYATMSDLGGEWDGGSNGLPTLVVGGGVTGGGALDAGGGTLVVVNANDSDALAQFSKYAGDKTPGPLIILVEGMIAIPPPADGGSGDVQKIRVSSSKTVVGANPSADFPSSGFTGGGLWLSGVSNVIIKNLTISRPNSDDAGGNVDAIHVETSQQIWIDHCDLSSNGPGVDAGASYDGLIDISDGSDFVTVSWTNYHDHGDTGLVGRSDSSDAAAEDANKNHVTYDHDLFSNVRTGPRTRFGTIHVLNSYFLDVANYGVAATDGATVRIEGTRFRNVSPDGQADVNFGPVTTILDSSTEAGYVDLENSVSDGTSGTNHLTTSAVMLMLPYKYMTDSTSTVLEVVPACVGPGHVIVPSGN